MFGKVSSFGKGYGFIRGDDGRRYYVRSGDVCVPSGILTAGSHVDFRPGTNDRGLIARNVRPL